MVNFNSDLVEVDIPVTAEKIDQQDILTIGNYKIMSPVWMCLLPSSQGTSPSILDTTRETKPKGPIRSFDLLTLINMGGQEQLSRLETMIDNEIIFDDQAESKFLTNCGLQSNLNIIFKK